MHCDGHKGLRVLVCLAVSVSRSWGLVYTGAEATIPTSSKINIRPNWALYGKNGPKAPTTTQHFLKLHICLQLNLLNGENVPLTACLSRIARLWWWRPRALCVLPQKMPWRRWWRPRPASGRKNTHSSWITCPRCTAAAPSGHCVWGTPSPHAATTPTTWWRQHSESSKIPSCTGNIYYICITPG